MCRFVGVVGHECGNHDGFSTGTFHPSDKSWRWLKYLANIYICMHGDTWVTEAADRVKAVQAEMIKNNRLGDVGRW